MKLEDSPNERREKREKRRAISGFSKVPPYKHDMWGYDGIEEEKSCNTTFHILLRKFGYDTFEQLIEERANQAEGIFQEARIINR